MNNRRKLILALGASAYVYPLSSLAQPATKVWRVGFLSGRNQPGPLEPNPYEAFSIGMRELGYVEGKNLAIEWRHAGGKFERFPVFAAELVQMKVDVIVAVGPQPTIAAQKATAAVPIVMVVAFDPVASGLVASLARPGGNITGLANFSVDLSPKHLEMLREMVPKLSRMAALMNPTNAGRASMLKSVEITAQKLNMKVLPALAQTPQEIETAFGMMAREKAGAVIVALDPFFIQHSRQIAELAAKHRLPSLSPFRAYVENGGLMSYGQNQPDQYRRMATFVDKIFKGARPGELPVEQPTKLELIINGKTAKALGLKIPQSLLIMADKVIE